MVAPPRLSTRGLTLESLDIVNMRAPEVKELNQEEGMEFVMCDVTKAADLFFFLPCFTKTLADLR